MGSILGSILSACGQRANDAPTPQPGPGPTSSPTVETAIASPSPTPLSLASTPTAPTPTNVPAPAEPAPTATPVVPGPGRLVGYLASWNVGSNYSISNLPIGMLTHLNYAFANVAEGGDVSVTNPKIDPVNLAALQRLRQTQPSLRVLISIGGSGSSSHFSPLAATSEGRQKFAQSCVQFLKKYGCDGVDLDWEYPTGSEERQAFTELLSELRRRLDEQAGPTGARYLLTFAAPAGPHHYVDLDLERVAQVVDWINLMTYAFHGTWSQITNFDAPLFASSTDPSSTLQRIVYNTDAAVQAYLAAGVPPAKLVVGVPFFGYGWKGVPNINNGLYQPADGSPPGTHAPGVFDYRDLKSNYLPTYLRFWHDEAQVPWLYNPQSGIMITYDDPESLGRKADYVRDHGLGGTMIWELTTDDASHSLVMALYTHLHAPTT